MATDFNNPLIPQETEREREIRERLERIRAQRERAASPSPDSVMWRYGQREYEQDQARAKEIQDRLAALRAESEDAPPDTTTTPVGQAGRLLSGAWDNVADLGKQGISGLAESVPALIGGPLKAFDAGLRRTLTEGMTPQSQARKRAAESGDPEAIAELERASEPGVIGELGQRSVDQGEKAGAVLGPPTTPGGWVGRIGGAMTPELLAMMITGQAGVRTAGKLAKGMKEGSRARKIAEGVGNLDDMPGFKGYLARGAAGMAAAIPTEQALSAAGPEHTGVGMAAQVGQMPGAEEFITGGGLGYLVPDIITHDWFREAVNDPVKRGIMESTLIGGTAEVLFGAGRAGLRGLRKAASPEGDLKSMAEADARTPVPAERGAELQPGRPIPKSPEELRLEEAAERARQTLADTEDLPGRDPEFDAVKEEYGTVLRAWKEAVDAGDEESARVLGQQMGEVGERLNQFDPNTGARVDAGDKGTQTVEVGRTEAGPETGNEPPVEGATGSSVEAPPARLPDGPIGTKTRPVDFDGSRAYRDEAGQWWIWLSGKHKYTDAPPALNDRLNARAARMQQPDATPQPRPAPQPRPQQVVEEVPGPQAPRMEERAPQPDPRPRELPQAEEASLDAEPARGRRDPGVEPETQALGGPQRPLYTEDGTPVWRTDKGNWRVRRHEGEKPRTATDRQARILENRLAQGRLKEPEAPEPVPSRRAEPEEGAVDPAEGRPLSVEEQIRGQAGEAGPGMPRPQQPQPTPRQAEPQQQAPQDYESMTTEQVTEGLRRVLGPDRSAHFGGVPVRVVNVRRNQDGGVDILIRSEDGKEGWTQPVELDEWKKSDLPQDGSTETVGEQWDRWDTETLGSTKNPVDLGDGRQGYRTPDGWRVRTGGKGPYQQVPKAVGDAFDEAIEAGRIDDPRVGRATPEDVERLQDVGVGGDAPPRGSDQSSVQYEQEAARYAVDRGYDEGSPRIRAYMEGFKDARSGMGAAKETRYAKDYNQGRADGFQVGKGLEPDIPQSKPKAKPKKKEEPKVDPNDPYRPGASVQKRGSKYVKGVIVRETRTPESIASGERAFEVATRSGKRFYRESELEVTAPPPKDGDAEGPVSHMRTGEGTAGAGLDASLPRKLAALYKGDVASISVKEILQNAVDAIRRVNGGTIRMDYDPNTRRLTAEDTGTGMSPDVAENQLLDVGGSYKEADDSSGGFGLAKAKMFSQAAEIDIDTTWKNPKTGQYVRTTIKGDGDGWVEGNLRIESTKLSRREGKKRGTGTIVHIRFEDGAEVSTDAVNRFMALFNKFNRAGEASLTIGGEPAALSKWQDPGWAPDKDAKPEITEEYDGGEVQVYASPELTDSYSKVIYLNNGLYQFEGIQSWGGEGMNPKVIVFDVRANVKTDDPRYAFTASREQVKGPAQKAIGRVIGNMGQVGKRRFYRSMHDFIAKGARKIRGSKFKVTPTDDSAPNDLVESIANSRYARAMADASADALRIIYRAIKRNSQYRDIGPFNYDGIGLGKGWLGINIDMRGLRDTARKDDAGDLLELGDEAYENNLILWNPFAEADEGELKRGFRIALEGSPDERAKHAPKLAGMSYATLVHEVVHQLARGHRDEFTGAITRVLDAVGMDRQRIVERLTVAWERALRDEDFVQHLKTLKDNWKADFDDIFKTFSGHHRAAEGDDAAAAIGRNAETPGRGVGEGRGGSWTESGFVDEGSVRGGVEGRGAPGRGDADVRGADGPVDHSRPDGVERFSDEELEAFVRAYGDDPDMREVVDNIRSELAHRRARIEQELNDATLRAGGDLGTPPREPDFADIDHIQTELDELGTALREGSDLWPDEVDEVIGLLNDMRLGRADTKDINRLLALRDKAGSGWEARMIDEVIQDISGEADKARGPRDLQDDYEDSIGAEGEYSDEYLDNLERSGRPVDQPEPKEPWQEGYADEVFEAAFRQLEIDAQITGSPSRELDPEEIDAIRDVLRNLEPGNPQHIKLQDYIRKLAAAADRMLREEPDAPKWLYDYSTLRLDMEDLTGTRPPEGFPKDAEEFFEENTLEGITRQTGGKLPEGQEAWGEFVQYADRVISKHIAAGKDLPTDYSDKIGTYFIRGSEVERVNMIRDLDRQIQLAKSAKNKKAVKDLQELKDWMENDAQNYGAFLPAAPALAAVAQGGAAGSWVDPEEDRDIPVGTMVIAGLLGGAMLPPASRRAIKAGMAKALNADPTGIGEAMRGMAATIRETGGSAWTQRGQTIAGGGADPGRDVVVMEQLQGRMEIGRMGERTDKDMVEAFGQELTSVINAKTAVRQAVKDLYNGKNPFATRRKRKQTLRRLQQMVEAIAGVDFEGRPIFGALERGRRERLPPEVQQAIAEGRDIELPDGMKWATSADGKLTYDPKTARKMWEKLEDGDRQLVIRLTRPEHAAWRLRASQVYEVLTKNRELLKMTEESLKFTRDRRNAIPWRKRVQEINRLTERLDDLRSTINNRVEQWNYLKLMADKAEARGIKQVQTLDELPHLDELNREHMRTLRASIDSNIEGWMHHTGFENEEAVAEFLNKLVPRVAGVRKHRRGAKGWEENIVHSLHDAVWALRAEETANRLSQYIEDAVTIAPSGKDWKDPPKGYIAYEKVHGKNKGEKVWMPVAVARDYIHDFERFSQEMGDKLSEEGREFIQEHARSLMRMWTKNQLISAQSVVNNMSGLNLMLLRPLSDSYRALTHLATGDLGEAKKNAVRALRMPAAMMQAFPEFVYRSFFVDYLFDAPGSMTQKGVRGMGFAARTGMGAGAGMVGGGLIGPGFGEDPEKIVDAMIERGEITRDQREAEINKIIRQRRIKGATVGAGVGAAGGQVAGLRTMQGLQPHDFGELFTQQFGAPKMSQEPGEKAPFVARTLAGTGTGTGVGGMLGAYGAEEGEKWDGFKRGAMWGAGVGAGVGAVKGLAGIHKGQNALLTPFHEVDVYLKRVQASQERLRAAEDAADAMIKAGDLPADQRGEAIAELVDMNYTPLFDRRKEMEEFVAGIDKQITRAEKELERKGTSAKRRAVLEEEIVALQEARERARGNMEAAQKKERTMFQVARDEMWNRTMYAPDYSLAPAWLNKWQKNAVGMGFSPYFKWKYFYGRGVYHHSVKPILDESMPLRERISALAAFLTLVAPFYQWQRATEERSEATLVSQDEAKEGLTYEIDRGGRQNLSEVPVIGPAVHRNLRIPEEEVELQQRTVKYPFADIGQAAGALASGELEGAKEAMKEGVSTGPLVDLIGLLDERPSRYAQFDDPKARTGDFLRSFVPGHRVVEDIGQVRYPARTRPTNFSQGFTGPLERALYAEEGVNQDRNLYGDARMNRTRPLGISTPGLGSAVPSQPIYEPLSRDPQLAKLALMFGINLKEVDKNMAAYEKAMFEQREPARQVKEDINRYIRQPLLKDIILQRIEERERLRREGLPGGR